MSIEQTFSASCYTPSSEDLKLLSNAKHLDERFSKQFSRRSFQYFHPRADMRYLPEVLSENKAFGDRSMDISYTYWPAKSGNPEAKTIVVLAGVFQVARSSDFFAELASEDANVVCLDYPGRGHSSGFALPEDYTVENFAKITHALLHHLNPPAGLSIVGHSYGAKVMYAMTRLGLSHPNWESAVLGDMGPETPEGPKAARTWQLKMLPCRSSIVEAFNALHADSIRRGAPNTGYSLNAVNHAYAFSSRPGAKGFTRALDAYATAGYCQEYQGPYNEWSAFEALPVRIMLTVGATSDSTTPEIVDRMTMVRPDATTVIFDRTPHYPELYTHRHVECVVGWIRQQPGDGAPTRGETIIMPYGEDAGEPVRHIGYAAGSLMRQLIHKGRAGGVTVPFNGVRP